MLTLFEFHGYSAVPEMLKKYRKNNLINEITHG